MPSPFVYIKEMSKIDMTSGEKENSRRVCLLCMMEAVKVNNS